MVKAIGAMGVALGLGVAGFTVFTGMLGAHAEAATLGLMGLGIFGLGRVFSGGGKLRVPAEDQAIKAG